MLPHYVYQKEIQVGEKISLPSTANASGTQDTQHQDEQDSPVEDEVTEFDKESCAGEESNSENLQITRDVDFLMGATSRFGRSVRFNSLFVF